MYKFTNLKPGAAVLSSGGYALRKLAAGMEPGLYDVNDNLVASWDTLVSTYGMDCTINYTVDNYMSKTTSPFYILNKHDELADGVKMVVGPVTAIGNYGFYSCEGLTDVIIPDTVLTIGNKALCYCDNLQRLKIGNGVTSIGNYAFQYCGSLLEVNIPDSVETIGNHAFFNCTNLPRLTIGNGVVSMGKYAVYGCLHLESLILGSSLQSIGDNAFGNDKELTQIVIPASVTSIGCRAFQTTTALTGVTFENTTGWWVSTSSTATSGTELDTTDASANAQNLKSAYVNYYWKRG